MLKKILLIAVLGAVAGGAVWAVRRALAFPGQIAALSEDPTPTAEEIDDWQEADGEGTVYGTSGSVL
jgi:hypothetical protein